MRKKIISRSIISFIFITSIFCMGFAIHFLNLKESRSEKLNTDILNIYTLIEDNINNSFLIVYSIAAHISVEPNITSQEFTNLAKILFNKYNNLKNVAAAPNNTITFVYPLKGNEDILGVNYESIPEQFGQVERAIKHKKMVLAGPLELIQGGIGIIARIPIFNQNNEYWGIVSSVLDFESVMKPIQDYTNVNNLDIAIYDLSYNSNTHIYGEKDINSSGSKTNIEINLPDRTWTVYISNNKELISVSTIIFIILLYIFIVILSEFILIRYLKARYDRSYINRQIKDFTNISSNWVWETDKDLKIIASSGELHNKLKNETYPIIGENIFNLFSPSDSDSDYNNFYNCFLSKTTIIDKEVLIDNNQNIRSYIKLNAIPYFEDNTFSGYRGVASDITEKKTNDAERIRLLELINDQIPITVADKHGVITLASNAFCRLSGYNEYELIGKTHLMFRDPNGPYEVYNTLDNATKSGKAWEGELRNIRKDGSYYWIYLKVMTLTNIFNEEIGYLTVRQDITDKKELIRLSEIDKLTGLYNRRKIDYVFKAVESAYLRNNIEFSIIMIDIDHFKLVNDKFGHLIGDEILKLVANTIKNNCRITDFSARWGGEEFIVISQSTNIDGAYKLAEKLRLEIEGLHYPKIRKLTCSFGVSSTSENTNTKEIINNADSALYKAKSNGRNCVKTYFEAVEEI